MGFANAVKAQQVLGGHGYVREWGMEQFVRDARIAMLYEGANGIQALDLVGRKLPKDGGRALQAFFGEVTAYIKERSADTAMAPYVAPLGHALGELQQATMWFLQNALGNPDNAGAGATDYMHLFGLVALDVYKRQLRYFGQRVVGGDMRDDAAQCADRGLKLLECGRILLGDDQIDLLRERFYRIVEPDQVLGGR